MTRETLSCPSLEDYGGEFPTSQRHPPSPLEEPMNPFRRSTLALALLAASLLTVSTAC